MTSTQELTIPPKWQGDLRCTIYSVDGIYKKSHIVVYKDHEVYDGEEEFKEIQTFTEVNLIFFNILKGITMDSEIKSDNLTDLIQQALEQKP